MKIHEFLEMTNARIFYSTEKGEILECFEGKMKEVSSWEVFNRLSATARKDGTTVFRISEQQVKHILRVVDAFDFEKHKELLKFFLDYGIITRSQFKEWSDSIF